MTSRPSLPATSSDFALHSSSAALPGSANGDDFNPLMLRFRRPSLLAPPRANFYSEGRLHSPLMNSFTVPNSRRHSASISGEESESDREKMWTDSPPSVDSGATTPSTPALPAPSFIEQNNKSSSSVNSDLSMKSSSAPMTPNEIGLKTDRPSTPPRPSRVLDSTEGVAHTKLKRMSHPLKAMPRIQTLLAESHLQENEVKSEAQFQRFVASFSELPRTPRAVSDRGRYPEEAGEEEPTREETPSDDEVEPPEEPPYPFAGGGSEPISILGKRSSSVAPSVSGDDFGLSESPGNMAMDVDFSRPPSACGSPKLSSSWRYTPPPTTSAVRTNKRKRTLDERYDPYPTSAKRRAVSPSISYLRDNQPTFLSPHTPGRNGRSIPHPIAIPVPQSGASSPVVSMNGSRPLSWGPQNVMSSPTLRAQMGLASPVLRPMMRRREEGREVDGAGEAVHGLTLE